MTTNIHITTSIHIARHTLQATEQNAITGALLTAAKLDALGGQVLTHSLSYRPNSIRVAASMF